jgi:hypothetical protein
MPYYPTKPGPELLVDMVNALLATAYTTDDFTFGTPRAVTRGDGRNTAIDLTVARGPLTGQVSTVYYNRLDLSVLLDPREIEFTLNAGEARTVDLVPALNTMFGWTFSANDLIDLPLEATGAEPVVQNLMAHPDSLICFGSGTCALVAPAEPPSIVAPDIYEAYGLNGVLYVVGPSDTPMVADQTFQSVFDESLQGYQFGPAKFAKYIEDTVYIDFNYAGFASNYSGTLDNVKLYGCDPATGAIVETITIGQVAWGYQYVDNYVGDPIALNPALAWRGELTLNITSSAGDPPMTETIDMVVGREEPYPDFDIVAIDGTPVDTVHPVPTKTYISNALSNVDHLTSIIYSTTSYPLADGPHTVTMRFQGVERDLAFEMVGT